MKKLLGRVLFVGFLALCGILGARNAAVSRPLVQSTVVPTTINEGNNSATIRVDCASDSWKSISGARTYRRHLKFIASPVGNAVCLGTTSAAGACFPAAGDGTVGVVLASATYDWYSELPLYCKGLTGVTTTTIYGADLFNDAGD